MPRRRILLLIFILPLVALALWALVDQVRVWTYPKPVWTMADSALKPYIACSQMARAALPDAEEVDTSQGDLPAGVISRSAAQQSAELFFLNRYGVMPYPAFQTDLLRLVKATFPDGQQRLAWSWVGLMESSGFGGMNGRATLLLLDGARGDPLLVVDRAPIGDPCMTCVCFVNRLPLTRGQMWAGGLAAVWVVGAVMVAGVGWIARKIKKV